MCSLFESISIKIFASLQRLFQDPSVRDKLHYTVGLREMKACSMSFSIEEICNMKIKSEKLIIEIDEVTNEN